MSQTKFKGSPVQLEGEFIRVGAPAPDFELVKGDLSPLRLADLKGQRVVLNIFPSNYPPGEADAQVNVLWFALDRTPRCNESQAG